MRKKRLSQDQAPRTLLSVDRTPNLTVLRLHERESLAGADLNLLAGLWDFWKEELREPRPVVVILAPPDLLSQRSLERLLRGPTATGRLATKEVSGRIIREANVIHRFIEKVRRVDSFVVGVVGGEVALPLAAPLLACDYRVVSSDTSFVNTTQSLPCAPLNCLPWLLTQLVGGARASQLLLDVPRMAAEDAHDLGLVNYIASPARLEEEVLEIAERLGSLPLATLVSLKRSIIASGDDFRAYARQEQTLTQSQAFSHWNTKKGGDLENPHSRS